MSELTAKEWAVKAATLASEYRANGPYMNQENKLTTVEKLVILRCKYAYAMARLFVETFTRKEAIDYQTIALNQFLGVRQ